METTERFTIDQALKKTYLSAEKKRNLPFLIVLVLLFLSLLLFNILHAHQRQRGPIIGISLFLFIFLGGMGLFMTRRRTHQLEQLLQSEFLVNSEFIEVINKFHFKKKIYFKDIYFIRERKLGMFVLKGKFSYHDLHASKGGPLHFFDDRNIFIPTITKDYERLIFLIRQYKKPDVKYHSSV